MRSRNALYLIGLAMIAALGAQDVLAQSLSLERDKMKVVLQIVSGEVQKHYYDPKLQGLDWNALVAEARKRIERSESPGEMITAIYALLDKLHDSHTFFLPPERINRVTFGFDAKAFGDQIRVYEIKPDGPAARAGLKRGDRILSLNHFVVERDQFPTMMLYYQFLRPVRILQLEAVTEGEKPRKINIEAKVKALSPIERDSYIWELREVESSRDFFYYAELQGGVRYIRVPTFTSTEDIHSLVKKLGPAKAVVIDLRGDSGGSLEALQELAAHFVSDSTEIGTMVGRNSAQPIRVKPKGPSFAVPLLILVDSESASAAEIFSYYFAKKGGAKIIGDRSAGWVNAAQTYFDTYGPQSYIAFGVQVTTAKVLMSDGQGLEGKGVVPDEPCLPTASDLRDGKDPCLIKAASMARVVLGLDAGVPGPEAEGLQRITTEIRDRYEKKAD